MIQSKKTEAQLAPNMYFLSATMPGIKNPANCSFWYKNQRMGRGMVGGLLKAQLKAAHVDVNGKKISNISIRKSMMDAGMENNVPGAYLSALAGQKAHQSKDHYVSKTNASHEAMARVMQQHFAVANDTKLRENLQRY